MLKVSKQCITDQRAPCYKSVGLLLLLLLILAGGCPRPPSPGGPRGAADKRTYIINFNSGQSDAMLVVHRGRSLLYDAGATMSKLGRQNFRDIPRRMEKLLGHKNLDYFVSSHYHQDHIGMHGTGARAGMGDLGLWGLINDEGVTVDTLVDRGFFVIGEKGNTQKHYERGARAWLRSGKVRRRLRVKQHDLIDMGPGLRVEVIAANGNGSLLGVHRRMPGFFKEFPPSENDYSVVLKFTKGALVAISEESQQLKSGARGLRAVLERSMIDIMFDIPNQPNVREVLINEDVIVKKAPPIKVYAKQAAAS